MLIDTCLTGTVNKTSTDLSTDVVQANLSAEESIYFRSNKILLVGYKQKKTRKPVFLITTAFAADDRLIRSKKSGLETIKPSLINEYSLNMGGLNTKDKSIYHLTISALLATVEYTQLALAN